MKILKLFLLLFTYPQKLAEAVERAHDASELDAIIKEVS